MWWDGDDDIGGRIREATMSSVQLANELGQLDEASPVAKRAAGAAALHSPSAL